MSAALALLRTEPRARVFFAVLAQSSLGTGAAYVALLVVAYDRFRSPWAISLVLLADFLPSMFLGPLLGAAVDRWSRRLCAVSADVLRAGAFVGIAVVGSFELTVLFALVAGLGTALFRPAALASIPSLVERERTAAATSLYGAITDFGYTGGPAIAAAALALVGPDALLIGNGVTFAVSALVIANIPFGLSVPREDAAGRRSLFREARHGLGASFHMHGVRVVIVAFAVGTFFGGVFNVVELPFATDVLGTSASGYSVLITVYGIGFIVGSLGGSSGGEAPRLKRRYLQGLLLTGLGTLAVGGSYHFAVAVAAFGVGGFGNGLAVVHQRLLFQATVESSLQGRVFAVADALMAWGFALGFLAAGAVSEATGPREVLFIIGAGEVALAAAATLALRGGWRTSRLAAPATSSGTAAARSSGVLRHAQVREESPHLVDGADFWLTLLDDLGQRRDDPGVELRPGIGD